MPCDLPYDCMACPKLRAYIDRHGPLVTSIFFCPVAASGNPTDPVKAEAV
jgi:hypothetical protein